MFCQSLIYSKEHAWHLSIVVRVSMAMQILQSVIPANSPVLPVKERLLLALSAIPHLLETFLILKLKHARRSVAKVNSVSLILLRIQTKINADSAIQFALSVREDCLINAQSVIRTLKELLKDYFLRMVSVSCNVNIR